MKILRLTHVARDTERAACIPVRPAERPPAHAWAVFLCPLLVCLTLSGCGATISSFTDKGTQAKVTRMEGNRLSGGITSVELNAQRFEKGGTPSISLFVVYTGPFFLNVEAGKSLNLIIDGARIDLSGPGSQQHREIVSLGLVQETAFYHDLDPELLRRIAYAQEVELEILSGTKVVQRHFNNSNFNQFKRFYQLVIQINPPVHE